MSILRLLNCYAAPNVSLVYQTTQSSATKSPSASPHVRPPLTIALVRPLTPRHYTLDATVLLVGSQITIILRFFLSRNIRIARERAWAQTVASRGKGPDFWQPYVEEWDNPPFVEEKPQGIVDKLVGGWVGRFFIRRGPHSPVVDFI
jgi:hypothetical protein